MAAVSSPSLTVNAVFNGFGAAMFTAILNVEGVADIAKASVWKGPPAAVIPAADGSSIKGFDPAKSTYLESLRHELNSDMPISDRKAVLI